MQKSRFGGNPANRAHPDQISTLPEDLAKQPFCNWPSGAGMTGKRGTRGNDEEKGGDGGGAEWARCLVLVMSRYPCSGQGQAPRRARV